MFVGFILLLPLTIMFEKWLINWSIIFIISFVYQILVPGVLGTLIWFLLVKRIGATKSAAFHFLNPFFGILIAAAIIAEPISLKDGIAVVIIMSGILAVQISHNKGLIQKWNTFEKFFWMNKYARVWSNFLKSNCRRCNCIHWGSMLFINDT